MAHSGPQNNCWYLSLRNMRLLIQNKKGKFSESCVKCTQKNVLMFTPQCTCVQVPTTDWKCYAASTYNVNLLSQPKIAKKMIEKC